MNCITLTDFRERLLASFLLAGDTLLNLVDALATETPAHSLAELSLSPFFPRQWGSLYQGLQRAQIDRDALRKLFASGVPVPQPGTRLVLGIDASSILRPCSKTAADRTYVHVSNLPEGSVPVAPGWQFSTLVVLPETASCWTQVLDNLRVPSEKTAITAVPLFSMRVPTCPVTFCCAWRRTGCCTAPPPLAPISPDGDNPGRTERRLPLRVPTRTGNPLEVRVWKQLHWKQTRHVEVRVIQIVRPHATDTERDPRTSWFVFRGEQLPPLSEIAGLYRRRYGQEHGYRADKQTLMWDKPRLRTPQQFQTWTDLVAATHNLLLLARPKATQARQPWENKHRELSLAQVRRAMGRILAQLPPLTRPVQPRGKSPGRAEGAKFEKAIRYKVVYKDSNKTKKTNKFV